MASNQMTVRRKIGLLGGSFNPVHLAHIKLAPKRFGTITLRACRTVAGGAAMAERRALC